MPEQLILRLPVREMFTKMIIQTNKSLSSDFKGERGSWPAAAPQPQGAGLVGERPDRLEGIEWHTRTLHTRADIIPAIEEALSVLEAASYSRKETFAIRLSLEEALVNAIKHGHKDDPSKEVRLRYHLAPEHFLAEVEDQGAGFKVEDVPDASAAENRDLPCGRGLLLMRNYMTWVRFNAAGNCVTLCRRRFNA